MKNYLQLHPKDQVVIALKDLTEGEKINRVTIKTPIPRWHKVAVKAIMEGSPVLKYGQVIGFATQSIAPGEWVHVHNLNIGHLSDPAADDLATEIPPDPIPIPDRYFLGFRRPGGHAATRNYILLAGTAECANHVVETALRELNQEKSYLLRRYPNVDGVIGLTHMSGCGLAALSEAHLRQNRTIAGFLNHPNAAERLVVGLGCEKGTPDLIFGPNPSVSLKGRQQPEKENPTVFMIQNEGGTQKTVDKIIDYVLKVLPAVNQLRRELIPASELILATQCGGSNALSGITANPAIGIASDLLIAAGGASFFAETTETFGAGHLLTRRAKTEKIAQQYLDHVKWWESYLKSHGPHFDNNPTPGNKEGGLTTIAEKSLGSVAKGGNTALCGVVDYAEPIPGPGLYFMNTPAYDPVSCTGQTAGGALVGVFSTGQGSCFGGLMIPWIKVVSNSETFDKLPDMEINAGVVLEGISLETVGRRIFEQVLAVASGAKTFSEKMNISSFNVWNTGVTT